MDLTQEQIDYFWQRIDKSGGPDSCWNWRCGLNSSGYAWLTYNDKNYKGHNLALRLTSGPPPLDKPWALHRCKQNRKCCNPAHLDWGTPKKNRADMIRDETIPIGEDNGNSKLTEQQVLEIRAKYIPGVYSTRKLGREYNVSGSYISAIINRKYWAHI